MRAVRAAVVAVALGWSSPAATSPGDAMPTTSCCPGIAVAAKPPRHARWQATSDSPVTALALSSDGRWLVAGWNGGTACALDATTGHPHVDLGLPPPAGAVLGAAFAPDAPVAALGTESGGVWVAHVGIDQATTRAQILTDGASGPIRAVAMAPGGAFVVAGGQDGRVHLLWQGNGRHATTVLRVSRYPISAVALSPDGASFAVATETLEILHFELPTGRALPPLASHLAPPFAVQFTRDGKQVFSADGFPKVTLFDLKSGGETSMLTPDTLHAFRAPIGAAALGPDGQEVAVATSKKPFEIKMFRLDPAAARTGRHRTSARVTALRVSPDGHTLFSGGNDGDVTAWTYGPGGLERTVK